MGIKLQNQKEDINMIEKEKKKIKSKGKEEKTFEFTLNAPEAREVYLAGEFNHWNTQSLPMKREKEGVWKAKIKLSPGRYEYKFFTDNAWVEDFPGAELVPNPFGTQNLTIWIK
jgi:1,4-alpha-glucan branching enzyme